MMLVILNYDYTQREEMNEVNLQPLIIDSSPSQNEAGWLKAFPAVQVKSIHKMSPFTTEHKESLTLVVLVYWFQRKTIFKVSLQGSWRYSAVKCHSDRQRWAWGHEQFALGQSLFVLLLCISSPSTGKGGEKEALKAAESPIHSSLYQQCSSCSVGAPVTESGAEWDTKGVCPTLLKPNSASIILLYCFTTFYYELSLKTFMI